MLSNCGWFPRNEAVLAPEGEFEAVKIEPDPPPEGADILRRVKRRDGKNPPVKKKKLTSMRPCDAM